MKTNKQKPTKKAKVACDHRWTIIALPPPPPEVSGSITHAVAICCKCLEKRFV
jgi:hypothetical protein